jgi:hypothetical protein
VAEGCEERATAAVMAWARRYEPTGHPVDEIRIFPLIAALDLLAPLWLEQGRNAEVHAAMSWLHAIARAGDRFYRQFNDEREVTFNNWNSIRLLLRASCGAVAGDGDLVETTRDMLRRQLRRNLPHADGASVDFHARDALHYHLFDLEALLLTSLLVPQIVDTADRARIERAVQFMRPYYLGEKKHIEYLHSHVKFDLERKRAGQPEFDNKPWEPTEARVTLRLARGLFREVREWSGATADIGYQAHVLAAAALHEGNGREHD